jgi:hypothetical protein
MNTYRKHAEVVGVCWLQRAKRSAVGLQKIKSKCYRINIREYNDIVTLQGSKY